jgi:hypothetical protein
VSVIDGNEYEVKKKYKDHNTASDILAILNEKNKKLLSHLKEKYKNSNKLDVDYLYENYNGENLSENIPKEGENTSYVLNKGDAIKLCLRDKKTDKFHDINTLTFVNLHELSHLLDKDYGHKKGFWKGFQTVLDEAVDIGIYKPVNYKKKPVDYCGMQIYTNPYFESKNKYI